MAYGWRPYVPVARRRARAEREMARRRKRGLPVDPVVLEGRALARTFWGQAWCQHLEQFSDFENRLPRGRAYVRNGSVCHLEIAPGTIHALVSGSELYTVEIAVKSLSRRGWNDLKKRCAGAIGSLLELLSGQLSDAVMGVVTDRDHGLFPLPNEIDFDCDCPDWADMCKHVAAVLYGVGARLDERPELLFVLRGVDHQELIDADAGAVASAAVRRGGQRRQIAENDLGDVFGIDVVPAAPKLPRTFTGAAVSRLRRRLALSRTGFARLLGVSAQSVSNWEHTRGRLNLHARTDQALRDAWGLSDAEARARLE